MSFDIHQSIERAQAIAMTFPCREVVIAIPDECRAFSAASPSVDDRSCRFISTPSCMLRPASHSEKNHEKRG